MVARKFTVPLPFCTELSRNSTRPLALRFPESEGSRTSAFNVPFDICLCTAGRSLSVTVKFA